LSASKTKTWKGYQLVWWGITDWQPLFAFGRFPSSEKYVIFKSVFIGPLEIRKYVL
jgi:hypothetical protein